jgi:hypothetical protein
LIKKYIPIFFVLFITGCIPYPRFDWANAKYYGQVVDTNGIPIENALVIVKNSNPFKSVIQVKTTNKDGEYKIEPEKVFMFFLVGGLAPAPKCIDELYVVHPDYNVYYKKRDNYGEYARLCTDIESQKIFVLTKKGESRKAENYEALSWENAKIGIKVYSYDELDEAVILDVNRNREFILIRPEEFSHKGMGAMTGVHYVEFKQLESVWYVKKSNH